MCSPFGSVSVLLYLRQAIKRRTIANTIIASEAKITPSVPPTPNPADFVLSVDKQSCFHLQRNPNFYDDIL